MPALNTTQGHHRVDTSNVVYLHRGHTARHELEPHCTPQEQEPTLIDHIRDIAALAFIVGTAGVLWVIGGCPGLQFMGN